MFRAFRFDAWKHCADEHAGMELAQPLTEAEHETLRTFYYTQGVLAELASNGIWVGQTRNNWRWISGKCSNPRVLL